MDNCTSHSSYYSLANLNNLGIKILFNVPITPAFNIIENVFAHIKYKLRKKININPRIW